MHGLHVLVGEASCCGLAGVAVRAVSEALEASNDHCDGGYGFKRYPLPDGAKHSKHRSLIATTLPQDCGKVSRHRRSTRSIDHSLRHACGNISISVLWGEALEASITHCDKPPLTQPDTRHGCSIRRLTHVEPELVFLGVDCERSAELAIAWLKINGTDAAIGLDEIKAKVAEARDNPLAEQVIGVEGGQAGPGRGNKTGDNITRLSRGTDTNYTLARLARDAPEMLDRIEAGELSVNAAAIEAERLAG